jgi:chitinase
VDRVVIARRAVLWLLVCVGAVALPLGTASAGLQTQRGQAASRVSLPSLWPVELDGAGGSLSATLSIAAARRAGVNAVLLDPGRLSRSELVADRAAAVRAGLRVIVVLPSGHGSTSGSGKEAAALCAGAAQRRSCAREASSVAGALRLARAGASGLLTVVRLSAPGQVAELQSLSGSGGRVIALTRLTAAGFSSVAWENAITFAALSPALDLAVTPTGASRRATLGRYLALLSRKSAAPASAGDGSGPGSPAPGPAVTPAAPAAPAPAPAGGGGGGAGGGGGGGGGGGAGGGSAPVNSALPVVSGTAQVGKGLSVSSGTWSGTTPITYTDQWQDCDSGGVNCVAISAATASGYTLTSSDQGHTLRVVVTATNSVGSGRATSAQTGVVAAASAPPPAGHFAQSVGFWPGWETGVPLTSVPWNALTQIDEFAEIVTTTTPFLNPNYNGVNPTQERALIAAAHAHNVLALLSIGGAGDNNWSTGCSAANRATLIAAVINQIQTFGYDGVDLDIEEGPFVGTADFNACVQAFYGALKATTTAAGKAPEVTLDTDPSWEGAYMPPIAPYVDLFNLMSYGDTCASNCASVATSIANLTKHGIPASQLTLGVGMDPGMPQATNTADCALQSQYAAANGLGGMMWWSVQDDYDNHGAYPCLSTAASFLG